MAAPPPPPTFDSYDVAPARSQPTLKERSTSANIGQSQAATEASQLTTEEKRATLPATVRKAEADATVAELKARQLKLALKKFEQMSSTLPPMEKLPEAREKLLREVRNLRQAYELSQDMFGASGIGYGMTSKFSGSPAATVDALIAPILANEAFTALSQMRKESPTGGALGNVTEKELELLKSAEGFINPKGGDTAFQQGLEDLIEKRIRVLSRMGVDPRQLAESLGPEFAGRFASSLESYRFRKEDGDALNAYVKQTKADGTYDPADFAALMGQAFYNATGSRPDQNYLQGALETGIALGEGEATDIGPLEYTPADEAAREVLLGAAGGVKEDELGWGETLGGAALNFVPSTFQLAGDTVMALTLDLPQTLEGVADIVAGATGLSEDDAAWQAVKDYYTERYGTVEGFKDALRTDPASIAADVAGIFTGGTLIAAKTAGTAGKLSRIAALSEAAKKAEGFGQLAAKLDPLTTATDVTKLGLKAGARTAENLGVGVPARLAGVQSADVKQAFDAGKRGSQEFVGQLEGTAPIEDPIAKAQAAVTELYQQRSRDYTRRMKKLKREPEIVAFDDVEKAIEGVRNVGRYKGIDISGAAGVWDEVDNKTMEFFDKGLNTIEDFDAMKRAIGNIRDKYQKGTPEYKVANDVAKAINKTITAKAPVYANIMKDYRVASDTLSDVTASLSTEAASSDTTLRKLQRAASERGPRGGTVLQLLENTKAGKGLGDMLAGQNLSATEPSGLGAMAGPTASLATGSPEALTASIMSPRGLGKTAYSLGEKYGVGERAAMALTDLPPVRGAIDKGSELIDKYGAGSMQALRVANPTLIQPQVDPAMMAQPQQDIDPALLEKYAPLAPSMQAIPAAGEFSLENYGQQPAGDVPVVSLDDLVQRYGGLDNASPVETEQGTLEMNGRPVEMDPTTNQLFYLDTGEPVEGFAKGGKVEGTWGDRARSVAKGATFAFNDEIEAGLRALAQLDPAAYQREVARIRMQQKRYEDANPLESLAYEAGGSLVPALIPGGQGASAARLARLAAKYPRVSAAANVAGQAGLYGVGSAESMRDTPRSVAEEMAFGLGLYGTGALGAKYGKKAYRKVRGRQ